jgi:hypothetical protein
MSEDELRVGQPATAVHVHGRANSDRDIGSWIVRCWFLPPGPLAPDGRCDLLADNCRMSPRSRPLGEVRVSAAVDRGALATGALGMQNRASSALAAMEICATWCSFMVSMR